MQTFAWFGHTITYEETTHMLQIDQAQLVLSSPQATILLALLERGALRYSELERELYPSDAQESVQLPRTLEKLIERLRKRLEGTSLTIYTIRGFGYIVLPTPVREALWHHPRPPYRKEEPR